MTQDVTVYPTETVPIGRLKAADYNPREMSPDERASLVRSITEFGFAEPVVARREDGLIVGGHQRVDALRELLKKKGRKKAAIDKFEVPVVWVDGLDDQRAKAMNLALNRIGGEWEYDKLRSVLEDLGTDKLLTEATGFGVSEIEDILALMSPEPAAVSSSDIDQSIGAMARRFKFVVGNDADAALCLDVLKKFGMTGPGNASQAFVDALRAAKKVAPRSKRAAKR